MRYLLRRSFFYVMAMFTALTLNFLLPRLMPGDPASAMFARFRGQLQPEALDALRRSFGFDDSPYLVQYGRYLVNMVRGDLGVSIAYYPAPVTEVIGGALVWTLVLAGTAVVVSFTIGTGLGVVAAWRRGGWLDAVLPPTLVLLGAFPYFWLALALLYVLGFNLGWFPLRHAHASSVTPSLDPAFLASVAHHAVLPATSIVLATLGGWFLGMRNTMINVLGEGYVKLAHAKGLPPRRVMWRYAARNALLPNVTGFGMALGFVLSGSLLTEIVFAYPGQGYLLIQAVRTQDFPLMQGLFLTITLAVLGANLLVDGLYVWLDPRTRGQR